MKTDIIDYAVINEIKRIRIDKEQFLANFKNDLRLNQEEISSVSEDSIKIEIKKKEKQINNLLDQTSLDDAPVKRLYAKIKEFETEIEQLTEQLGNLKLKKLNIFKLDVIIEFVNKLLDKCESIDDMEFDEKEELVNALLSRVAWSTAEDNLEIEFFGNKKTGQPD